MFNNTVLFTDEEILELSEMVGMNVITYDDITGDEIKQEFDIAFPELFDHKKEVK